MNGGDSPQLTESPTGVQQFAWRPDGSRSPSRLRTRRPKRTGEERHNDSFEIQNNHYLLQRRRCRRMLWLIPAAGGRARRLTSGSWTLPVSHPPSAPSRRSRGRPMASRIALVRIRHALHGRCGPEPVQMLDVEYGRHASLDGP